MIDSFIFNGSLVLRDSLCVDGSLGILGSLRLGGSLVFLGSLYVGGSLGTNGSLVGGWLSQCLGSLSLQGSLYLNGSFTSQGSLTQDDYCPPTLQPPYIVHNPLERNWELPSPLIGGEEGRAVPCVGAVNTVHPRRPLDVRRIELGV